MQVEQAAAFEIGNRYICHQTSDCVLQSFRPPATKVLYLIQQSSRNIREALSSLFVYQHAVQVDAGPQNRRN
jgi:hypothetical protein